MKRSGEEAEGAVESINVANTLMLLSRGEDAVIPTTSSPPTTSSSSSSSSSSGGGGGGGGRRRVFECKTCDRQFPSFQALGGHRASHKKLKMLGEQHGQKPQQSATTTAPPQKKPKVHECPVCGLEFAMGQALGGHMRRHRSTAAEGGLIGGHGFVEKKSSSSNGKRVMLDLNLPPLEEDGERTKLGVGLGLGLGLVCR